MKRTQAIREARVGRWKTVFAFNTPNLFLPATAPEQGEEPAAKEEYPRVDVAAQNASGHDFTATALRTCLIVSCHNKLLIGGT